MRAGMKNWARAVAGCAATVLAVNGWAASFKIGYAGIPQVQRYTVRNVVSGTGSLKEDRSSYGVITFGGASMTSVLPWLSVGVEGGASTAGEWTLDLTNTVIPAPGTDNSNTGDSLARKVMAIPVVGKIEAGFKAGPGRLALGLGLGAVIIGVSEESKDQQWWDGAVETNVSRDKSATRNNAAALDKSWSSYAVPMFTIVVAPSYTVNVTETLALGLELPIWKTDTFDFASGQSSNGSPSVSPGENTLGLASDGMMWGVNLVVSTRI